MKVILISIYFVVATVYNALEGQTDSSPDITASGFKINMSDPASDRIIAVSRDLEPLGFTFGRYVKVTGAGDLDGIWRIEDRMNKRFKMRIDFLVENDRKLGKWSNVKIQLIE